MTLLETLVAATILSLLLVILFGFFRELSVLNQASDIQQKKSFQMRYLDNRLGYIFERVVNENDDARVFYFYLEPPNGDFTRYYSLVFTYDNGIQSDPYYSGDVLGRIYLDLDHKLHLVTWPLKVEDPFMYMKDEILMTDVTELTFNFYSAPSKTTENSPPPASTKTNAEDTEPEKDKWLTEWPSTHRQMPSLMTMTLVKTEDEADLLQKSKKQNSNPTAPSLQFDFVLPSSKNPVHYFQDDR